MTDKTIEMIEVLDIERFSSHVTKEYYDVLRELISIILLLDGYKTRGEGAHRRLIEYLQSHYRGFDESESFLMDDLRIKRNKIAYDGFFVTKEYIERKVGDIQKIINKLKEFHGTGFWDIVKLVGEIIGLILGLAPTDKKEARRALRDLSRQLDRVRPGFVDDVGLKGIEQLKRQLEAKCSGISCSPTLNLK